MNNKLRFLSTMNKYLIDNTVVYDVLPYAVCLLVLVSLAVFLP